MAINDYASLKSSIADWLNRADLASVIPDFISLAEARFNRVIRVREMLTRRYTSTTDGFIAMPGGFLEAYQLQLPTSAAANAIEPLHYVGPDDMAHLKVQNLTGMTRYYTIIDGAFELLPAPSDGNPIELHLTYYAKIPSLSEDNPTNWLLSKAPDLYLYSALSNAAPYLSNDERIPVWSQMASAAFDELTMDSERAMRSRSNLTTRRRGF